MTTLTSPSGFTFKHPETDAVVALTFSDLIEITRDTEIDPGLFTKIRSALDEDPHQEVSLEQVQQIAEEIDKAKQDDRDLDISMGAILPLTVRLQAARALTGQDWMQQIVARAERSAEVARDIESYLTTAELVFDPDNGCLAFDVDEAKSVLDHLKNEQVPDSPSSDI